jgi:hypothetical protein
MNVGRANQVSAKLINQQVLVVGGVDTSGFSAKSAELYQPPLVASPMVVPSPTPTVKPSTGPTPRATPTKTPMHTPTPTPTPTQTATPTPSPTPSVVPPSISSIPGTILVGGSFMIDGANFTAGSKVNLFISMSTGPFNPGAIVPTAHSATQLNVDVPATTPLGQGFVEVQVVNTDQKFVSSNSVPALLQGSATAGIPSLTSINGTPLGTTSRNPSFATDNVETVVIQGSVVKLGGNGFDTANGVAVDLFCACTGGKVGPFFLNPGNRGLSKTLISFPLPATGSKAPPTGPGSFLVSNKGADGKYSKRGNAVSVPIGQKIKVTSVTQVGSTITVIGAGFSRRTVINFFNTQPAGVMNLGGLKAGKPKIALTLLSPGKFTFAKPAGAAPGPSYVQALNPPFVPFTSSGNAPGGAFTLK